MVDFIESGDTDSACSVRYSEENAVVNNSEQLQPLNTKIATKISVQRLCTFTGHVFASDISNCGVYSTSLAEHLIADVTKAIDTNEWSKIKDDHHGHFKLKLEKVRCQIDHLKAQLKTLEISLTESRTNNENLSIVCAQLEANQTALALALSYADRIQECTECLLMMAETQLSLLLAKCQAKSKDKEHLSTLKTAHEQRHIAETIAADLVKQVQQNHVQNDQDVSYNPPADIPDTVSNEDELRSYVNELKIEKVSLQNTILPVSTNLYDALEENITRSTVQKASCDVKSHEHQLALENAILMQELTALKENQADLKAQLYLAEKENELMALTLSTKENELNAHKLQNKQLLHELQCIKTNDGVNVRNLEKFQEIDEILEKISIDLELKSRQSDFMIGDLKKGNEFLIAAVERLKRKQRNKISKIYHQIMQICQPNTAREITTYCRKPSNALKTQIETDL